MTVIGRDVFATAGRRNKPLRSWLTVWTTVVEQSEWHGLGDVRVAYPSADGVTLGSGTVVTIFNVQGNRHRLLTWIDFDVQVVEALEVLTHAEYDKNLWKARY